MTNESRPFVHLRVHSNYTLGTGISKATDFVKVAIANGQPAFAVTDACGMAGALTLSLKAKDKGIQPIIATKVVVDLGPKTSGTMLLLAKSEQGYANVCEILRICLDPSSGRMGAIRKEDIALLLDLSNDVIVISGVGADSFFSSAIRSKEFSQDDIASLLDFFGRTAFPGNFFFEVCRNGDMTEQDTEIERIGLQMALDLDLPIVATSDVWYAENDRRSHGAYHIMQAISENRKSSLTVTDDGVETNDPISRHMRSNEEMRRIFADLPEAYDNTLQIARSCSFIASKRDPILPPFDSGDGRSEAEQLRDLSRKGLEARLAKAATLYASKDEYFERLDFELGVIERMKFPGYFLIVADFIGWSHANDIPVGLGRGSGAGSLVAWSLGITGLDPLQFSLLFERFLNPDRVSMPDFDIDFCGVRRDEVINYVREKYGSRQVANIATFMELKAKGAIRDAARVIVPEDGPFSQMEINSIAATMPTESTDNRTLVQLYSELDTYRHRIASTAKSKALHESALLIEGLYKTSSSHAAGVVIAGKPLTQLVPISYDKETGGAIVQFNMKDAESSGLVKFDFLGLKTLTSMTLAVKYIEQTTGEKIDLDAIPYDDPETMEMLAEGNTLGVFQFESGGMQKAMRQVKPTKIEDLIAVCALYRPGPMEMIPLFGERKNGLETEYPEPVAKTKPILEETFGIIVYQEQVMQIAQAVAGYSLGEADLLRRAMGKKIRAEMDAQRSRFEDGAVANGLNKKLATEMFDLLAKFADYGFNKSHAAAYGVIGYRTAWLKKHYPAAFYASLMTTDKDKEEKIEALCVEARSIGIKILPPDINKSSSGFTVEKDDEGKQHIRFAISAIKGISSVSEMEADRRERGPYRNLVSFYERVGSQFNGKILEKLAEVGAFDSITDGNRRKAVAMIEHLGKGRKENKGPNLFGDSAPVAFPREIHELRDWDKPDKSEKERAAVGFFFASHPLDSFESSMRAAKIKRMKSILDHFAHTGGASIKGVKTFGLVTGVFSDLDSKGRPRLTIVFADQSCTQRISVDSKMLGNDYDLITLRKEELDRICKDRVPIALMIDVREWNGSPFVSMIDYAPIEKILETDNNQTVLRIDLSADFDIHYKTTLNAEERRFLAELRSSTLSDELLEKERQLRKRLIDLMVSEVHQAVTGCESSDPNARKIIIKIDHSQGHEDSALIYDNIPGMFEKAIVEEKLKLLKQRSWYKQFGRCDVPPVLEKGSAFYDWQVTDVNADGKSFDMIRRLN